MKTTYGQALNYLKARDIQLSHAWSEVISFYDELPEGVRQALIDRLINSQRLATAREQEKLSGYAQK